MVAAAADGGGKAVAEEGEAEGGAPSCLDGEGRSMGLLSTGLQAGCGLRRRGWKGAFALLALGAAAATSLGNTCAPLLPCETAWTFSEGNEDASGRDAALYCGPEDAWTMLLLWLPCKTSTGT